MRKAWLTCMPVKYHRYAADLSISLMLLCSTCFSEGLTVLNGDYMMRHVLLPRFPHTMLSSKEGQQRSRCMVWSFKQGWSAVQKV